MHFKVPGITCRAVSFNDDSDLNHSDVRVTRGSRPPAVGGIYLNRLIDARRVDNVAAAKYASISSKTRSPRARAKREEAEATISAVSAAATAAEEEGEEETQRRTKRRR